MRKCSYIAGLMLFAALLFVQPSKADSMNTNNYQLTGNGWNITFSLPQTLTPSSVTWNGIVNFTNVAGSGGYVFNSVLIGNSSAFGTDLWAFGSSTKSLVIVAPGLFTWNADGTVTLGVGTFTVGDYNSFLDGRPMQYTLTIVDPPGGPSGNPVSTPEPASLVLLGVGGLSLGAFRRKANQ
jgi:PEP-CTERM motif